MASHRRPTRFRVVRGGSWPVVASLRSMPEQCVATRLRPRPALLSCAGSTRAGRDFAECTAFAPAARPRNGCGSPPSRGGTDEATARDRCVLTVERRTLPGDDLDAVEPSRCTSSPLRAVAQVPGAVGACAPSGRAGCVRGRGLAVPSSSPWPRRSIARCSAARPGCGGRALLDGRAARAGMAGSRAS